MPRHTFSLDPSEPSTSSQPVAGPSSARPSQRAMTFHHYQPPTAAVDHDDEQSARVADAVSGDANQLQQQQPPPLRWAPLLHRAMDENPSLTSPSPRIPHHPTLPPPPSRSRPASATPHLGSSSITPEHSTRQHVPRVPLNPSPRTPSEPSHYGDTQRPLGHARPSLDPNSSSQHESLNQRTAIFTDLADLAAHHGIPQFLPPLPHQLRDNQQDPSPVDAAAPTQPQPELQPDFDYITLCSNYLSMLSQNNIEMPPVNADDLAAVVTGAPVESDAMQLILALLSGSSNIPIAPEAPAPQFTSPAFLSSPLDTPLDDFLDTPAIPDMDFSPDIMTSPVMLDYIGPTASHDLPLFEDMPSWGAPPASKSQLPSVVTTSLEGLLTLSPETPALDPSSLTPSPAFTDASTFPESSTLAFGRQIAPRPRKSMPTGTRKNVTPETLIPLDAPIQPRKYLTPSSTSRKDLPATFARKRARTVEDDDEAELDTPLNPNEEDAIANKRLQNTLAARRSRKRKLEYQRQLEDEAKGAMVERDAWRARALQLEGLLAASGMQVPPIDPALIG